MDVDKIHHMVCCPKNVHLLDAVFVVLLELCNKRGWTNYICIQVVWFGTLLLQQLSWYLTLSH